MTVEIFVLGAEVGRVTRNVIISLFIAVAGHVLIFMSWIASCLMSSNRWSGFFADLPGA